MVSPDHMAISLDRDDPAGLVGRNNRLSDIMVARLNKRAGNRAVRTINATIAGFGFQNDATSLAVVEPLTGINWHRLALHMAAYGTNDF